MKFGDVFLRIDQLVCTGGVVFLIMSVFGEATDGIVWDDGSQIP